MSFLGWLVVGLLVGLLVVTIMSVVHQRSTTDNRKDLYLTIKELDYDVVPYEMMTEHISDEFGLSDEESHRAIAEGTADHIDYFKKLDI